MTKNRNPNHSLINKQYRLWLKRLLAIILLVILSFQIKNHGNLDLWWQNLLVNWQNPQHRRWLFLAIILMPLNWTLEISKWRLLMRHSWQASWGRIAKAVLAGISISLITPNRVGEYGGRAILVPENQAATVILTSIIGGICQWLAFIICGWPALIYLLNQKGQLAGPWLWALAAFVPIIILALFFTATPLFKFLIQLNIGSHQKWIRWLRLKIWSLRHIQKHELLGAWLLALLRLFVYTIQYLLLLWFFDISLTFWLGVSGIFSIYLIQAGIPLPPGLDVITRSELAIWIWGSQLVNPVAILSATFSLYLLNLIIPALLGSWLIVKKENKKLKE